MKFKYIAPILLSVLLTSAAQADTTVTNNASQPVTVTLRDVSNGQDIAPVSLPPGHKLYLREAFKTFLGQRASNKNQRFSIGVVDPLTGGLSALPKFENLPPSVLQQELAIEAAAMNYDLDRDAQGKLSIKQK